MLLYKTPLIYYAHRTDPLSQVLLARVRSPIFRPVRLHRIGIRSAEQALRTSPCKGIYSGPSGTCCYADIGCARASVYMWELATVCFGSAASGRPYPVGRIGKSALGRPHQASRLLGRPTRPSSPRMIRFESAFGLVWKVLPLCCDWPCLRTDGPTVHWSSAQHSGH